MNLFKKFPYWAVLLFLPYMGLGWYVARSTAAWQNLLRESFCSAPEVQQSYLCLFFEHPFAIWSEIFLGIVALALALVHPVTRVKSVFGNWLESDTKAFLSVIVVSYAVVVILTRSDLLATGLGLLIPGLLARLELRLAGYRDWPSFWIVLAICAIGYGVGLLLYRNFGT